ncbi:carbonic anhydrase [Rubidibacter lacunae]
MKGLLDWPKFESDFPQVYDWLRHAAATLQILVDNYSDCDREEESDIAVAENVLTQIENLRTYPSIRSKLHQGRLHLHAWVYQIVTGEVLAYDANRHAYVLPDIKPGRANSNGNSAEPPPSPDERSAAPWLTPQQSERFYQGLH